MKPFDLEAALRGEKVVTGNLFNIDEIVYFKTAKRDQCVIVTINGEIVRYSDEGELFTGLNFKIHSLEFNLFMAPTKTNSCGKKIKEIKKGWVNIDIFNDSITILEGKVYLSEEEAKIYSGVYRSFAKQIEIEWEE